jgi:hypothetical protein
MTTEHRESTSTQLTRMERALRVIEGIANDQRDATLAVKAIQLEALRGLGLLRACRFCGGEVTSLVRTEEVCRTCYFLGKTHEEGYAPLLARLRESFPAATISIDHTGGNCWGLAIRCPSGRFLFATAAIETNDGEWDIDSSLPDENERWALGFYSDDDEGFMGGEPQHMAYPLTDEQLEEQVAAQAKREAQPRTHPCRFCGVAVSAPVDYCHECGPEGTKEQA